MTTRTKRIRRLIVRAVVAMLAIGIVGFIVIQLIPVSRTNPPVMSDAPWGSQEARALAVRACYDCHSNETVWPWYSRVAPASWLVARDVESGRRHLNFSDWANVSEDDREAEEMAEVIYEGEMPPIYYVLMHPEARLSDAEQREIVAALQALSKR